MDSLDKIIKLTALKAAATNQVYIVYKTGLGYEFIVKGFRKGKYEAILIPEKDKIVVKDAKNKLITTISTAKEKAKKQPKEKASRKEEDGTPDEESSSDKAVS